MPLFGKKKDKSSGIMKNYEKVIKEGFEAASRGDEDKAILGFRKVLRWVTEDIDKVSKLSEEDKAKLSDLLTDAGEEMIKLKQYDSAIKLLEKAKTINPKNFRAWMAIGKDLLQRNTQVPYALVCLREASKLEPENVEVHLLLGDAYRIQGQHDKALAAYQRALKVDPENEDALQKVLKIQPENVDILERYIKVLEGKGESEELVKAYNKIVTITGAPEYLERGLELDPENKDLLINKARLLLKEDKIEEAKKIVSALKDKYPDDPDISMLYDELNPKETPMEEEKEELKPIEVTELFGDIGIGESEFGSIEPEHSDEKIYEGEKEASELKEQGEEAQEAVEEEKVTEEEESKVEEGMEEFNVESMSQISISPYDMFLHAFEEKNLDDAGEILKGMRDEDIEKIMSESKDAIKFAKSVALNIGRLDLAIKFAGKLVELEDTEENKLELSSLLIESGAVDDAEKLLNEIVKKNMKNGKALYLKARIMSVKGNDMGARNFLMMATKFNPELKEEAKSDKYFEKYRDKDWFVKITS